MAERDENVYLAKLAEQAERYDGKLAYLLASKAWSFVDLVAVLPWNDARQTSGCLCTHLNNIRDHLSMVYVMPTSSKQQA